MNTINEIQVLTNIRLSQAQKYVLTKLVLPNTTPLTSYESVSTGKNVVANRNILVKLGMVQVGDNEARITEKGMSALKNENLIDDSGALTPQGEEYAYAENLEDVEKLAAKQPEKPQTGMAQDTSPITQAAAQQPKQIATPPADISFPESGSLIYDMETLLSEKYFIEKHPKKL